ncbi:MAG: 4Fe-4S binding protein [Desulfobacterales bacterium]|jgi:formate hydrogenlyase subunit 6/NADH:ubiquinone oxidoreductase subunit I
MPKFSINNETCIQCHECEENCPVQGIDIEAEPPRIQDPCIYCWRCVTICPTLSLEADWEPLVAMAPANYARYKKELDKVTARGEFRWLIDPETIVFDDPLYKQRQREIKDKE